MQKFVLSLLVLFIGSAAFAQSAKYLGFMKQNVALLDTAHSLPAFQDMANRFERVGDAEKTQALPYYYAAYCTVMMAMLDPTGGKGDQIADKADGLIAKAEEIGKPSSETSVIRSLIATARLMVDPQNRYMQYGPISGTAIAQAIQMDSTNPRPVLLEAQAKFYTPEAFGGGKEVAKPLFQKALAMFGTFRPASDIAPRWGQHATEYFLSQCN